MSDTYDIGLRIAHPEYLRGKQKTKLIPLLSGLLKEYRLASPLVAGWAGRGDFNPQKLPERITPAIIKHASRTAGRLRAKGLRSIQGR